MATDNSAAIAQLKLDIAAKETELNTNLAAKDWPKVKKNAEDLKDMNKELSRLQRGQIFVLADFTAIAPTKDAQLLTFVNKTINTWLNNQPVVYANDKNGPWTYVKISNPEAFVGSLVSVQKNKDA
jgi:hypothetical protein